MSKIDKDSATLALMELAEAFGAGDMIDLLPLAMDGRLFLRDGKAVYILARPVTLKTGDELKEIVLREPVASDYVSYSRGMSVTVSKDGSTEIDTVMMTRRTISAVSKLSDQPLGIIEALAVRDIRGLGEVCEALGFFE